QALLGTAKTSTVVLLDNSYSMDVGTKGRTTFIKARDAANQIVRNLARGSEVSVLMMGGIPGPLLDEPTFAIDRADRELAKLQTGYGSAATPAALEMAVGALGKMHEAHRELIVISDFQKVSWADTERIATLMKQLPVTPAVTFMHIGREEKNNLSVQSLDFSRFLLGVGQKFQVRANLKNHGETPYPNLRVYFRVDGQERAATQVSLGPNEDGQVLFSYTFETAGSHVIAIEADAPDSSKSDNILLASVPVWNRLPVLLVNGNPGREPLTSETDFLEIALRPYSAVKTKLADLITTTVIKPEQLDANQLKDQRVVVLANVPQLDAKQLKALEDFVRGGGGLLIFPGSRIKTDWYNTKFTSLFPWRLTSLEGSLDDTTKQSTILVQHYEHPALALFNDPRAGNLATATIRLWYKFAEENAGSSRAPAIGSVTNVSPFVVARLNNGDPFLVEKRFGDGSVIACSVPCAADWSNLPLRPFYLPLMQQLVTYLAAKFDPPRNVDIGRPLIAALPAALAGKKLDLTDPAGLKHKLTATNEAGRALVHFDETRLPGLYILDTPTNVSLHFVVNTSRTESDLTQLTGDEIKAAAKPWDASVVSSWDEYREHEQRRRFGREMWRPLLWVLLGLIFTELVLEQRVGRLRR
ncbi:MAG: VWA domain-containing protein, partial [Verrucomicrobiota bacterium]